jgi:hypothetical protein
MRKIIVCLIVLLAATLASSGAPPDRLPSLVPPAQAGGIMMVQGGVPPPPAGGCSIGSPGDCTATADTVSTGANYRIVFTDGNNDYYSNSFVASANYTLKRVDARLGSTATDSSGGTITAYIYSDTSQYPNVSLGASTNTVGYSTITAAYTVGQWLSFYFEGVSISSGTKYHVVLYGSAVPNVTLVWRKLDPGAQYSFYSGNGGSGSGNWNVVDQVDFDYITYY